MDEIIWKDTETGQKFIVSEEGEKIFIMDDGSRVYESDLILEHMLAELEEQEFEERIRQDEEDEGNALRTEEQEMLEMMAEEERRQDEEDSMRYYEYLFMHSPDELQM